MSAPFEVHHRVPQCLLTLRDKADELASTLDLGGEDIEAWLDYEFEALRWGVEPEIGRDELERLVAASTQYIPYEDHRGIHAADFARWGSRGGMATLKRYGREWFVLLAKRRHNRITAEDLARFEAHRGLCAQLTA